MFEALKFAVKVEGLSPKEKLLLIMICDLINSEKGCIAWPSNKKLAELCGNSKKTIIDAKKELVEKGLIVSQTRFNASSLYKVNVEKIKSYIPKKDEHHFEVEEPTVEPSENLKLTEHKITPDELINVTPAEEFLHPPSVKKVIYTPRIPINLLQKDTALVDFYKLNLGEVTIDNWLEKGLMKRTVDDPRDDHYGGCVEFSAYQLLPERFNNQLAELTTITDAQWNMAVDIYEQDYSPPPYGHPNLRAMYVLCRFLGSKERTRDVWRAFGGEGITYPAFLEKGDKRAD